MPFSEHKVLQDNGLNQSNVHRRPKRLARNARTISEMNNRLVLNCLRQHQPIACVELARRLGMEPPTVSRVVRRLAEAGFVREGEPKERPHRCGRRPTLLHLDPAARYVIGVDVIQSGCNGIVTDLDGRVILRLAQKKRAPQTEQTLFELLDRLLELLSPKDRKKLAGVGIGAIDADFHAGTMRVEDGFIPIVPRIKARFGLEAFVEENSNAFAIAEKHLGFGRSASSFLCKWYRYGIGHSLVIEGKLFRGVHNAFGELRDYLVPDRSDNAPDDPFRATQVRPQAIAERAKRLGEGAGAYLRKAIEKEQAGTEALMEAVADGIRAADPMTRKLVDEIAWAMSVGFSTIVDFVDPELVIVGGPITSWGDYMRDRLRKYVGQLADRSGARTAPPRIEFTRLGADVIALGGAALVLDRLFTGAGRE